MASKTVYMQGKIKWAKGLGELDEEYGTYSAMFYPDEKSVEVFKKVGMPNKLKSDDDGTFFNVRRKQEKKIKGKDVTQGPPKVFLEGSDGSPDVDLDPISVGNGSTVTVKITVYDTSRGSKGATLEAVRVDELIEFIPAEREVVAADNFDTPFD